MACVLGEARLYREDFPLFDSLYIGGGTPSLLGSQHMTELFRGLADIFTFADDREMTVEMNPDDVSRERLALLRSLGVNRISLGVQSFTEGEVRFLGRRHSASQAEDALRLIRDAGFPEFGIDLIYGLPGQTVKAWERTIQKALSFGPVHISCYQLTIEGDTPFSLLAAQGALKLPDDGRQAELFLAASTLLSGEGFIHYEVSNFALGMDHLSRHNVKYWQHTPYLGLGPSAHSFSGGRRWWNMRSLSGYVEKTELDGKAVAGVEMLEPGQLRLERLLFGFRTQWGVAAADIPGVSLPGGPTDPFGEGLVDFDGARVTPTRKGYLFADRLPLLVSG